MDIVGESFTPYGAGHWLMLAVTAVGAVLLVLIGRRVRSRPAATVLARVLAGVLFTVALINLAVGLLPADFTLAQSLPLHFSDVLRFVAAYALWSRHRWATTITYYWGLTLNPQALLTPNLHYTLDPVYDFTAYWAQHVLVMWAPILLTWGLGERPDWRSYRLAVLLTVGWAAVIFPVNLLLGTNYGFLNRKPASASALDYLGDWPLYLAVEFAAMIIIWALITWPWTRSSKIRQQPGRLASPG